MNPHSTPASNPYLTNQGPYPFCPGCSHTLVAEALAQALEQMQLPKEQLALVTDIGCVGMLDKHFAVNTFHGLHGRSITYATGLKLARPEMTVVVAMGDGACGIGGHHLIQAARRGIDITVLLFNNFNYGMTGGEHSATTPCGARTATTPHGNPDPPLDVCALAMAAGAGFVARIPAFDAELPQRIRQACEHPGFALLDIWEICTAYFMPNNSFKKSELLHMAATHHLPFGLLRQKAPAAMEQAETPTPPSAANAAPELLRPMLLEQEFPTTLQSPLNIVLAGSAGQKIKSAATLLGRAAIRCGLFATQKDDYPVTIKTGHSVAEVILSPRPILFTGIVAADIALILSHEGLGRSHDWLAEMSKAALVLIDAQLLSSAAAAEITRDSARRLYRFDGTSAAAQVGRDQVVYWALGFLTSCTSALSFAALQDTAAKFLPAAFSAAACRAIEMGAAQGRAAGAPATVP